jgi:hypothetical protein
VYIIIAIIAIYTDHLIMSHENDNCKLIVQKTAYINNIMLSFLSYDLLTILPIFIDSDDRRL